jgi:hypothetical protein
MSITAYDASNWRNIPADAIAIFPWSDGAYHWSNARFPKARYRYLTALGNPDADIADFEPGCIWPGSKLRLWAEERLDKHPREDLTVYTDRDNYPLAVNAMTGFAWHLFLATQDGTAPETYESRHVRAVQITDRNNLYDVDEVFDVDWLNVP